MKSFCKKCLSLYNSAELFFCVCVFLVILSDGFVGCDGGDVKSSLCCSDYVVPEIGRFCL
jgi:hypothetical protein